MANTAPSKGFLSRFFGKKEATDIELPNESGRTDRRLKKKKQEQEMPKLSTIVKGYKKFMDLGKAK